MWTQPNALDFCLKGKAKVVDVLSKVSRFVQNKIVNRFFIFFRISIAYSG